MIISTEKEILDGRVISIWGLNNERKTIDVFLKSKTLQWLSNHKYLGVHVNEYVKDYDIKHQMKAMYTRCNIRIKTLHMHIIIRGGYIIIVSILLYQNVLYLVME